MPPSRTSPRVKEEAQAAIPEDGSVASMLSMPSRMLRRQGKQKEKGEGETTFTSIRPMLQRLEDARRRPGFTEADWMTFVHYLAGITSLIEFEEMTDPDEPIMERLRWLTPPPGRETWEWSAFINYATEIDKEG